MDNASALFGSQEKPNRVYETQRRPHREWRPGETEIGVHSLVCATAISTRP
jgi:hypothetical protein